MRQPNCLRVLWNARAAIRRESDFACPGSQAQSFPGAFGAPGIISLRISLSLGQMYIDAKLGECFRGAKKIGATALVAKAPIRAVEIG